MPQKTSHSPTPTTTPEQVNGGESDEDEDPLSSERDSSSDESPPRECQDLLSDQKKLDKRFTSKQLAYLNERKDAYRSGSANQRSELAQATGQFFLKRIMKKGRDPSKEEIASLYDNVRLWYAQRARSRHGPMHWTINWTGRQVFYKENTELVVGTQKVLFELETGEKTEGGDDAHPDLDPEMEGDVAEVRDPQKPVKLFHFFQRALTAEWNALALTQREEYEKKALLWREKGPSLEERRRLAQKECGRVIHEFADEIYRQMGVRLHFLVSYEDSSGEHVAFSLDFNNQIDNGVSFKQRERAYLEKVDLEGHYAAFVRRTLPEEADNGEVDQPTKQPRKRGDPAPLELDRGGIPIIPDISTLPQGVKAYRYLPDLIRSVMRHDHASARGLSVSDPNSSPPWKEMALRWRKWISEDYWPDGWPIGDPSTFGVDKCRTIIRFWYERQQRGEIPFQFHSYWVGGEAWEPREVPKPDISEGEPRKRRAGAKGRKRSSAPKKSKENAPTRAQRPTSTARQSATDAVRRGASSSRSPVAKGPPQDDSNVPPPSAPSDSESPLAPTTPRPRPRPKAKARSKRQTIESDTDAEMDIPVPSPGAVARTESPALQKLIGKTAGLSLKGSSGEMPVTREGHSPAMGLEAGSLNAKAMQHADDAQRKDVDMAENETTSLPGSEVLKEYGVGKRVSRGETVVKLAGEVEGGGKDGKSGRGEGGTEIEGGRHPGEEGWEKESRKGYRGGRQQGVVDVDSELQNAEREQGNDEDMRQGKTPQYEDEAAKQNQGKKTSLNDLASGRGATTQGGDDVTRGAVRGERLEDENPGSASTARGAAHAARRIPVEDRQLLESAAAHIPLTTKRIAKKKVQFGTPAAEPRSRARKGK